MADHYRRDAVCRSCYSEERHRALRLFLNDRFSSTAPLRILHFAPEPCMWSWINSTIATHYVTADIERPTVDVHIDMTAMGIRDESFDLIIASHVLEHVSDDAAAMRELFRVLRPGGTALVMVPIDASRAVTFEDSSITSPAERQAAFWQPDHVRLYGRDFPDRLRAAGLSVNLVRPALCLPASQVRRFGLEADPAARKQYPIAPPDEIYVATRGYS